MCPTIPLLGVYIARQQLGKHIQTHRLMGGTYEVRPEMGSSTMIYIPCFIKIGLAIQKLMGGIHIQTNRHLGALISILLFFSK
jgi:hypothetical protein